MKSLGPLGEELASDHLVKKGYRLIERNFKIKIGEIDIIAEDGQTLVFVEVKTRLNKEFGQPFEAVNLFKQKKIRCIAEAYLQRKPLNGREARFDVISILLEPDKTRIEHIENAF